MKVILLDVLSDKKECQNKDVMGGFGSTARIGDSFLAKFIERRKKKWVKLPLISLGYVAAILEKNGHQVRYSTKIVKDADLVIIHSSIVNYKKEIRYADIIRKTTKAKVGFIGPFSTFKPEIFIKHADFVIKYEPEEVIMKIKDKKIPKGIITSKPINNLDTLPFPKWDTFPYETYSYMPVIKKRPFIPVLSSRGCLYSCSYCPYQAHYGKWRRRSVENVILELKYLKKKFGVKGVMFRDALFTADKQRAADIADAIIKNKIDIEWACETHLHYLDEKLIDKMYESGLRSINLGIESADKDLLKNSTRVSAKRKYEQRIIKYCEKKGVKISAFYLFGYPGDTVESIERTIKYSKKLNTNVAQFFIMTPFPGTKFYEKIKSKITAKDFEEFDSFTPVFKHDNLTKKQLLKLKEKAFLSYYYRPRYVLTFLKRMLWR